MDKYVIEGGHKLNGEVTISGAKNAAVAIIPAVILAGGPCILENLPMQIRDVEILFSCLTEMGAKVRMINNSTVEIDATVLRNQTVSYDLARQMRGSYYFLGALLGKYSTSSVSMPGGCDFGLRPIDQHIKGFEFLGATVAIEHGMINVHSDMLIGSHIFFDGVSVGATINVMLAAVKAKGVTILENVAKEPHVVDVANFLNSMGADIRGAGTDVIKIHGVDILHGTTYSIIPDQIEAGTYMVAVASTGGDVLIKNVIPKHLESITDKLIRAGVEVYEYDDSIRVRRGNEKLNKVSFKALPHPGFPTDMQPQMTAMLTLAEGTSVVTEDVWPNRFRYIDELRRLGAKIQVDGKVAVVEGVDQLMGAPVRATDLRAGAAMIIAGLAACGVTEIEDIHHVERGYQNICSNLIALGADIKKISIPENVMLKAL